MTLFQVSYAHTSLNELTEKLLRLIVQPILFPNRRKNYHFQTNFKDILNLAILHATKFVFPPNEYVRARGLFSISILSTKKSQ